MIIQDIWRNPSYYVAVFQPYKWKSWKLEAGVTTLHPIFHEKSYRISGPGIIPSDTGHFILH
jgi:hypothetical protein